LQIFHGSGMSTGPHPMTYCREALSKLQVKRAYDLSRVPDGQYTRVAGCVIARQRPGTAKGLVFLSLEDERGISNVIVNPDLCEKYRVAINREKVLQFEGVLQNQHHTISNNQRIWRKDGIERGTKNGREARMGTWPLGFELSSFCYDCLRCDDFNVVRFWAGRPSPCTVAFDNSALTSAAIFVESTLHRVAVRARLATCYFVARCVGSGKI
jgi:hypothetical protein